MLPEALLLLTLHAGERHAAPTSSEIIAAAGHIPPRWRAFKRCIVARESHGNARARNPHSSAQGKFQFLDRSWRYPLAGMIAQRLTGHGMSLHDARAIRDALRHKEIARWSEALQDVGFASVITVPGGSGHWRLSGSPCESFR